MEDFLFKILNPIFIFIFWIIFDKERFLIAWSIFFIINLLFLIIYFLKFNDKESDRP
jgi:hypothetical protein